MKNTPYDKSKLVAFGCLLSPIWGWDSPEMANYIARIYQLAYDCKNEGLDGIVTILCPDDFDTSRIRGISGLTVNFIKMDSDYFNGANLNKLLTSDKLYSLYDEYLYFVCVTPTVTIKNVRCLFACLQYTLATNPILYDWIGSITAEGNNLHFRKVKKCIELCKKYGESDEGDLKYFLMTHFDELVKKP